MLRLNIIQKIITRNSRDTIGTTLREKVVEKVRIGCYLLTAKPVPCSLLTRFRLFQLLKVLNYSFSLALSPRLSSGEALSGVA